MSKNGYLRFVLVLSFAALVSLSAAHGVDLKPAPSTTEESPSGISNEPLPTPSWTNIDAILQALENESASLSQELKAISEELTTRKAQAEKLQSLLTASELRYATLERSLETERKGAEVAIRSALDREKRAEKERDFWLIGGITMSAIGLVALALSYVL